MKRALMLAVVAGLLGAVAAPALARKPVCIEIKDPEHAESYFLCV